MKLQIKINRLNLLVVLLLTASTLMAQGKPNLRTRSFDAGWSFKKENATSGPEAISFDASTWRKVDVPHDWSIEDLPNQMPGSVIGPFSKASVGTISTGFTIGGTAWYRKTFKLNKEDEGKKVLIEFDGVYMNSDVWINGHHLGTHNHGYTPFYYDLTPYLLSSGKDNLIAVRIKNEGQTSRWYSGSGIYRHVNLTVINPLHIDVWGVNITTPKVSKNTSDVQITVNIKNENHIKSSLTLQTQLIDAKGKIVSTIKSIVNVSADSKIETKQFLKVANPKLWSTETPYLYKAKVAVLVNNKEVDALTTNFGIRDIKIDAQNGLLINGISTKLKGGCIHHDNGPLGAMSFERAEERKIELMKANGFNAIRTSHNPPSTVFLEACDRLGMLVIDEAFDTWNKQKRFEDYHLFFQNEWNKDLTSMILRDRNHPSIILWSIGNEIPERISASGLETRKMLVKRVHELDPSRKVTEAINAMSKWEEKTPAAFRELDVSGYNYEWKRYENDHAAYPERVMYASESTGFELLSYWNMVEKHPYVIGDFVWTAMDYIGEAACGRSNIVSDLKDATDYRVWPWFNANCGDLDLIGDKKPQSYYRDIVWRNTRIEMFSRKPIPTGKFELLSPWGWPDVERSWNWSGLEGKNMNVIVYTRCPKVKLELNGKLIGEKELEKDSITVSFDVPYQAGKLVARGYENDKEVTSIILETTGKPFAIRLTADRKKIKANRNDLSYVHVDIVDANGRVVPNVDDIEVSYSISGNGELAAVGNGNPVDVTSFQQSKKKVFHGKGLVIIKSEGTSGKILLEAQATGLKGSTLEIITQ
jgi:beta-galactosidase